MRLRIVLIATAFCMLISILPETKVPRKLEVLGTFFASSTAHARPARRSARRTGRRTARRTTRRVSYRRSVAGCPLRRGYYYCGGVYYRRGVVDGATVYIVVNP